MEPVEQRLARTRRLWHLLEPLHAIAYYAPETRAEAAALGYEVTERWPLYFAWRAAPLGAATAESVASAFYSFAPDMVAHHVPKVWRTADPEEVLRARSRGVDAAYRTLFGDEVDGPVMAEAADLVGQAARAAVTAGRPLAAANAALPFPTAPHLALWQAATTLREHRGDGHLAALQVAGLDPVEALVSFAAVGAAAPETFASRGWTPEQWRAGRGRLEARGLLAADGVATEAGRALRAEVERHTDAMAGGPWDALGEEATTRLADLLGEFWVKVIGSGHLPAENTLGIGRV
ncbi:SCO6745 family protein (plasmid) [Streptomyces sp. BI20]|uniref:SCO6745 family protein n=1 Tax=Streptomyces sp. BI20 TaxID=3403460 RepID=UPI003C769BCA